MGADTRHEFHELARISRNQFVGGGVAEWGCRETVELKQLNLDLDGLRPAEAGC
jgi:hypothetical protein